MPNKTNGHHDKAHNGAREGDVGTSESAAKGQVLAYDHITFWVGNAKQAATYYCLHFGFRPLAYSGLESGSRERVYHAVALGSIVLLFVSAVEPLGPAADELSSFLSLHGDGVRDVAFRVDQLDATLQRALTEGATLVQKVTTLSHEGRDVVRLATVATFGDVTHTFVERHDSHLGPDYMFLPGFVASPLSICMEPIAELLPPSGLQFTDHVVGHFPEGELERVTEWYERTLSFHRFWSVDEDVLHTDYSGIRSHIVTNGGESIKMPLCEVVPPNSNPEKQQGGHQKAQSSKGHEYVHYNGGRAGIHHIAFHTDDIVATVSALRRRGVQFLHTPDAYYDQLRERLKVSPIRLVESMDDLKKNRILIDYDERGYLLQIFTRPLQDRPTLVLEVIQRRGHDGFGAGNFLALFQAIEAETAKRGNLD